MRCEPGAGNDNVPHKFLFITIAQKWTDVKNFLHEIHSFAHTKAVSSKKEESAMNCHANKCIECTVKSCAYHCDSENYCSLDRILVGTHEANPTQDQCTDCKSFRKK